MYENNFSRNIDNNDYYIPQNYRPTYDNPYDARFVNSLPSNYYEDNVIPSYNRRMQQYDYNNENYNYLGGHNNYYNYSNVPNFETRDYIETDNVPDTNYAKDIKSESDFIELYPEIYKKIMPIIDNVIKENKIKKVNNGVLDILTLEVYDEFENNETKKVNSDNVNSAGINKSTNSIGTNGVNNNIISKPNNNTSSSSKYETNKIVNSVNTNSDLSKYEPSKTSMANTKNEQTMEVATRYRNTKNPTLRDLIRILILNRLFRNWNMPRPPRPRPYQNQNYNPMPFPTSNYNLVNRYEGNYGAMPDMDYIQSYFNSPYPEDN